MATFREVQNRETAMPQTQALLINRVAASVRSSVSQTVREGSKFLFLEGGTVKMPDPGYTAQIKPPALFSVDDNVLT